MSVRRGLSLGDADSRARDEHMKATLTSHIGALERYAPPLTFSLGPWHPDSQARLPNDSLPPSESSPPMYLYHPSPPSYLSALITICWRIHAHSTSRLFHEVDSENK